METYLEKMGRLIKEYKSAVRVEIGVGNQQCVSMNARLEASRRRYNAAVAVDAHRKSITDYEENTL